MKGVIYYSSQNGSTKKVAQSICSGIREKGIEISITDIENEIPTQLSTFDFIGIGSPVFYFRPSLLVMDFLKSRHDLEGKKVFTFVTYGSEIGDGANWLREIIKTKNAIDIGHFTANGKHLFPGYISRGYIFSPDSPTENELAKARSFGESMALVLLSDKKSQLSKYDSKTHWILKFERFVTNRIFIRNFYSYFFKANKTRCNSCGICSLKCPSRNIKWEKGMLPKWGRDCTLCCNCEINCPEKAIKTPISWMIFAPFLNYNIKRTKRNNVNWELTKKY